VRVVVIEQAAIYSELGRLRVATAQQNKFLRGVLNASTLLTQNFQARGFMDRAFPLDKGMSNVCAVAQSGSPRYGTHFF